MDKRQQSSEHDTEVLLRMTKTEAKLLRVREINTKHNNCVKTCLRQQNCGMLQLNSSLLLHFEIFLLKLVAQG